MDNLAATVPLTLHVVRHPNSPEGKKLGDHLQQHFGPARHQLATGGTAPMRVLFSNAVTPGTTQPNPNEWEESAATAVVILIDDILANDDAWKQHAVSIAQQAEARPLRNVAIPVALSKNELATALPIQALRWDQWENEPEVKTQRLIREITYQMIRVLRHQASGHDTTSHSALGAYLEKANVFLSHAKHDCDGERIAEAIRTWLHAEASLSAFMDVKDIPAGTTFASVIDHQIEQSIMAVVYTDAFSSREWCQREVLHAKRQDVPILVIDCLKDTDARSFPYLGNTPVIRMDPDAMDRMEQIAFKLLDEAFKSLLWDRHVKSFTCNHPNTTFTSHAPELATLIARDELAQANEWRIVYPDPPLGEQEQQLIASLGDQIRLQSLTQWVATTEINE